ncbi:HupE/UreJ family protein [Croceitalea rosinachiae]|uniref:HupE/UreJ family protein n=1 Tax=Croceitalea rosinachiae TaxID=3075596 RepID=A0ABU3A7C6_9FLAO|nr:HupE/UreJ family protein [Croceitalea sp. F388]MDT0606069.1 HupE/UreJ family protein [Croceitalea sp. F388]
MQDFWFYIKLGLEHVLDLGAYDHILFLAALAIPFTFKNWKQVVILATIFTIAHCASLAFSVYGIFSVDVGLIEFLIPVTIALTALLNFLRVFKKERSTGIYFQALATTFFGLIHGFGFSNYFNMLMAEEENKFGPLLGFATGIELSQVTIILVVLVVAYLVQEVFKIKQPTFIGVTSILILLVTIPMLIATFPN